MSRAVAVARQASTELDESCMVLRKVGTRVWGLGFKIQGMEKKMETTIVFGGYIGVMEKKMETTGIIGVI